MEPDVVGPPPDPGPLLARLRAARFAFGLRCPHCDGRHVQRWGMFRARQRYRCLGCRRTFSDLTGTPAYYSKRLALWPDYALCLQEGLSIRRAASRIGVHPSSAFRWRHRLLDALRVRDAGHVAGWVEIEQLWFAHSRKGERRTGREPRTRGQPAGQRRSSRRVPVILACDRVGGVTSVMVGTGESAVLVGCRVDMSLGPGLAPDAELVSRSGPWGPIAAVARRRGLAFHRVVRPKPGRAPRLATTETVHDYRDRLLDWIARFRGVATKYLPNYLAWHRAVDVAYRLGVGQSAIRWPLPRGPD